MTYSFTLQESDYLTHQLFTSSVSKRAIKKRRKSWLLLTAGFALLALVSYNSDHELTTYMMVITLITFIFYPFYAKWNYKKHFLNHIREHLSSNFGKTCSLEFLDEHLLTFDENGSESKISLKQITSIHELPEHLFIRLEGGQTLIIPKGKVNELEKLKTALNNLAKSLHLTITDHTKWSWNKSW